VTFTYDGLGRRLSKRFRGRVTKWVWDGDKPLHEWTELEVGPGAGSISDLTTWLFEEDSFVPAAKLTAQGAYSVVCDYLGTPLTLYNTQGQPTWDMSLDSYGGVRTGKGQPQDCPFRYQGQYEDVETGLYYNRFRYFDPETSQYLSQDPLRLLGGHRLYAYVDNPLSKFDRYGLSGCKLTTGTAVIHHSPGANPREFGHYSIETRLVNENGEVIKTTYTHQVTTPDGSQTWIKKLDGPHEDFTHSSEPIELSNIEEAQLYQNKMTRGWPTGGYDVRTNSCVTHVSNVLRKGGVDIGEGAFSQIKYLKKLPYIPK
jgi:RHS repeat-associated protein